LFHSIFSKLISSKQESGQLIKKTVSKDERAWFFSFKEKRAKTVSERIFHAKWLSAGFTSIHASSSLKQFIIITDAASKK